MIEFEHIAVNKNSERRRGMKKILFLAVAAVMLIAAPAMAKEGPYIGVGLTYVGMVGDPGYFKTVDAAMGLELRAGYSLGSIAFEGNLIGSTHQDSQPGFSDGDFKGASIDLRLSFSQEQDPTQFYLLVGLGAYKFTRTDTSHSNYYELTGGGVNLGAGFEHFFNQQVAIDLRGVYRAIQYDVDKNGAPYATGIDGDAFTLGAALNLHF